MFKLKTLVFIMMMVVCLNLTLATQFSHRTNVFESAVFYVTNAKKIRVSVFNTMHDIYPRCFTAWIILDGRYVNLDGQPYEPDEWQKAWEETSPNCFSYPVASTSGGSKIYDLTAFTHGKPYTGVVEVRVSSYCYEVGEEDPCYYWDAEVEVVESYSPPTTTTVPCRTVVELESDKEIVERGEFLQLSGNVRSYDCYEDPEVKFYFDDVYVGRTFTDSSGNFEFLLQVPSWAEEGYHWIKAVSKVDCCEEGYDVVDVFVESPQTCELVFKVRNEDGEPVKADVYLDGNYLGYGSFFREKVEAGGHRVIVYRSGYEKLEKYISCSCGEEKVVYLVLRRKCDINLEVEIPEDVRVGEWFLAWLSFENRGEWRETVTFDAFVCGMEGCKRMICEDALDPVISISPYSEQIVECRGKVEKGCEHWIKVVYEACGEHKTKISEEFYVRVPKCIPHFLPHFRCFGNWKQQKYVNENCEVVWENVEYCEKCVDGRCVKKEEERMVDVFLEPENYVKPCEINKLTLVIYNRGDEDLELKISVKNAPEWFFFSGKVKVKANETKEVPIFVEVPCDARGTFYFDVEISGDYEEVLTSTLKVERRWTDWITGMFEGGGNWIVCIVCLAAIAFLSLILRRKHVKYESFENDC